MLSGTPWSDLQYKILLKFESWSACCLLSMAGVSCTSDPLSFTLPVHMCALKCSRIFRRRRNIQHTRYKIQKDTNNIQKNCIRCERRVSLGSKKPGPPPRSPFELPDHVQHLYNTFTCTNVSSRSRPPGDLVGPTDTNRMNISKCLTDLFTAVLG